METVLRPVLMDLILQAYQRDQLIREELGVGETPTSKQALFERCSTIDKENSQLLASITRNHGWPTISMVGKKAAHAASVIARHADHDVELQKWFLNRIRRESPEEVNEIWIAYLYDRICVNSGRPQFYGTQFTTNVYGAYGPQPIEEWPIHVDIRRASIGLEPLEEYKISLEMHPT